MDTFCKKLFWFVSLLTLSQPLTAQHEISKQLQNTYTLSNSGTVEVNNKYGNVTVNGWEKNEVSVEIRISVNHRKKENAEALLKRIEPVTQERGDFVFLGYKISEKNEGWFANVFEKANPFDYGRSNIQIDYSIQMPINAELKVTNIFGDVLIEGWTGKLRALVEHGDLWISENLNKADITMKYGKLRAQNMNYGSIAIRNGSLDMEDSKSLRLNSTGSDIDIRTVTSFEITSNKDNIDLEEAGTLFGTLKFTTLELERLTNEADMTLRISDFRVAEITSSSVDIAIQQESSEISLNIANFSHEFNATLEQGVVRLPKSFENIDSRILDEGKKLREIKASYGSEKQGHISITGKKGVVLLKEL